jgi:hypothetical protein
MHSFFNKDNLELKLNDGSIITIPNPYSYMLVSLINMVNSLPDNIKKIIKDKDDDSINKYYRVRKYVNDIDYNLEMVNESDVLLRLDSLDYSGIPDKYDRNDTLIFNPNELFPNNTVFISIGKKYIIMLNKFFDDKLKTEFIPKNKQQLEHHFKFTAWVITREYAKECIKIYYEHLENPETSIFHKIPENIKNDTLYNITSLTGAENTNEFISHVEIHNEFIKKYIISKDHHLCKAYSPSITTNPLSDISDNILHLHFMQDIIHLSSLKMINIKNELLKSNSSIYDLFLTNARELHKIKNLLKGKNDIIFNFKLNNSYLPIIKLSLILGDRELI